MLLMIKNERGKAESVAIFIYESKFQQIKNKEVCTKGRSGNGPACGPWAAGPAAKAAYS
jgi:hypothetical protein